MKNPSTSFVPGRVAAPAALACAVLLAAAPAAALAGDIVFTVKGTIIDGVDAMGMFGPAGGSLAGQPYSMSLFLDPDKLAIVSDLDTRTGYSQPGVPVSLNGTVYVGATHAYGWALSFASQAWMSLDGGNRAAMGGYGNAGDYRMNFVNDILVAGAANYFDSLDFNQVIKFENYTDANPVGTTFSETYVSPSGYITETTWFVGRDTYATWGVMPVPEPSGYALLLAGLAGVGAYARRRRS